MIAKFAFPACFLHRRTEIAFLLTEKTLVEVVNRLAQVGVPVYNGDVTIHHDLALIFYG